MGKAISTRRVLFGVSSLSGGGAERVIAELANAFAEREHSVAVLTLSSPGGDHYRLDDRVKRIALDVIWDSRSVWQSVVSNLRLSRRIRRAVLGFRPDVVVSFIEQTNVRILAALIGSGIPVIVAERVDPRRHAVGRVWHLARRLLYPSAARLVVQTEGVAGWARGVVGGGHTRVLCNFVRALALPPAFEARDTRRVLGVGRLDRQKGFDLLLLAFARSGLVNKGVGLTILGEGPERRALEALARELGVADAVDMPGVVPDPERWMAQATVFVLPSRYEGFPNALLEAMAMGCPVIAADCDSGPREIIRHGENGWLVPVEDVEALAQALRQFFEDAALRARLGAAAVEVRVRYSKRTIVTRWEELIEEVLRA